MCTLNGVALSIVWSVCCYALGYPRKYTNSPEEPSQSSANTHLLMFSSRCSGSKMLDGDDETCGVKKGDVLHFCCFQLGRKLDRWAKKKDDRGGGVGLVFVPYLARYPLLFSLLAFTVNGNGGRVE